MTGFDRVAAAYQHLWTDAPAGRWQRDAVWSFATECFPAGSHVLDLGCGTGDDALWLMGKGVQVTAIDSSLGMVRVARRRGVNGQHVRIEDIGELSGTFDGAVSNFGAMNCVEDIWRLRSALARLIRPGGTLVICVMSRFCFWETLWFAARGRFRDATRRWSGTAASSLTSRVHYPTVRTIRSSLAPEFSLVATHGIGVAVPPSYVTGFAEHAIARLGALDRRIASYPIFRSLGDHTLLIFRREARS